MYAEPRHSANRPSWGCLPGGCSMGCVLPLMAAVFLFGLAAVWYLQYSELRVITSNRQPVEFAEPDSDAASPDRYICREVRPELIGLVRRTGLDLGSPHQRWVLLLDRTHAMDWLVVASPPQNALWLPMEGVVELAAAEVPTYSGPGAPNSATYMLGLVAYDARTGQFTIDPQAFSAFVASSAAFRDCPLGTFAELGNAAPDGIAQQAETPSRTSPSPDDSALAAVGWNGTVNTASNLRTGPGTEFPILRVLPAGTKVAVVGVSDDGEWLALDDGNWIFHSLVTRDGNGLAAGGPQAGSTDADTSAAPVPEADSGPIAGAAAETDAAGNELPDPLREAEDVAELRLHMLDLINRERTLRGLEPVVLANNAGAQRHVEDLVANGYLSHWNLRGETPYMRHTWAGGHDYSAENLSFSGYLVAPPGFCAPPVSRQALDDVMAGLMDSPGHRDNILTPLHREVNIGIAFNCRAMAVAQVFEGEYVRFGLPPALAGGRLAMAGRVSPEVELNDNAYVLVAWDPPLTEYTSGQVSQTVCYSTGRPVAYIRRPLPPGFTWVGGESQPVDWERCPGPRDADPNLRLPEHRAEIDRMGQRIRDGFRMRETVEVALVTAAIWQAEAGSFHIEADLGRVIQTHGPGIYSVVLWGEVDGVAEALTTYAIKVDG